MIHFQNLSPNKSGLSWSHADLFFIADSKEIQHLSPQRKHVSMFSNCNLQAGAKVGLQFANCMN
jgi:hypothetical protein